MVQPVEADLKTSSEPAGDAGEPQLLPEVTDNAAGESGETNAVSLLQEYIQGCSSFSPHTKILSWNFDQQLEGEHTLQFRATVSFVFNDVPHHFAGGWQTSKKKAQRDTAERVRHYLAKRNNAKPEPTSVQAVNHSRLPDDVLGELKAANMGEQLCGAASDAVLDWKIADRIAAESGVIEYRATVTFAVHGVPHHFGGAWCSSQEGGAIAAKQDTADRVLWYFGQSEDDFVYCDKPLSMRVPGQQTSVIAPPSDAPVGNTQNSASNAADDKTVLMQVQNALQKHFAKETPPGHRVWLWSYQPEPNDPQLFRAHVEIPGWARTFQGAWCRGKKLAQRNACLVVKQYLEEVEGKMQSQR
eukprot:gnl/TRDRNA2_/TRDRNA2_39331_c0_seq1.p1 gnl/TRDRNA2_/TRDRNA2_39331_c0~~gnl/TRDRNA2_/TRDRNA2_39331_c0_seq1.p1  ORF type:complete len:357 (-),score=69.67 gnl/TRDRNA2_/TRDRNA2_39331_c0_seq1:182-1252(-)